LVDAADARAEFLQRLLASLNSSGTRQLRTFRLQDSLVPLRTQAVIKVDNRIAAPRSGPRGGRNHAWKRGEAVAGGRESVPISCVGMMAVERTAIVWCL